MRNPSQFLQEVRTELSKVVWPSREEIFRLTLIVIFVSVIVGVFVGGLDFVFTNLMNVVLGR